jgi:hypothetical protein
VKRENAAADADPESVRLSIDTKAVINLGPHSRGGLSRGPRPVAAVDHDLMAKEKLVPGGVLELGRSRTFLFFTESCKTSDFMVDGIHLWWRENQGCLAGSKRLVINLDNGPEGSGHRRQFWRRLVAFADREELEVRLLYSPPYHRKYHGIERYWGGLERAWNGYLLASVAGVLLRASQFFRRSARTTSTLLKGVYRKGVKLCGQEKQGLEKRLSRSNDLPWWDITIQPLMLI